MLNFATFMLHLFVLEFRDCLSQDDLDSGTELSFGEWYPWDFCPTGLLAHAFEIEAKEEENGKIIHDEVGMTGLRFYCKDPEEIQDVHKITSYNLRQIGTWRGKRACPNVAWLIGFRQRIDPKWGWAHDDTAANDVEMVCSDGTVVYGGGNLRGSWTKWANCSKGNAICGLQTKVEDTFWDIDRVGLVSARLRCCPLPPILNHTDPADFDRNESSNGSITNQSSKGKEGNKASKESDHSLGPYNMTIAQNNVGSKDNPQYSKDDSKIKINSTLIPEEDSYSSYDNSKASNDTKLPSDKVPEFIDDSKFRNDPNAFDSYPELISNSSSRFINISLDSDNPFKNERERNSTDNSKGFTNFTRFGPKFDDNSNISKRNQSTRKETNMKDPSFYDPLENDHVYLEKHNYADDPVKRNHKKANTNNLNNSSYQDGFDNMNTPFKLNQTFRTEPRPDIHERDKKLETKLPRSDGNFNTDKDFDLEENVLTLSKDKNKGIKNNTSTNKADDESEFQENSNDEIGDFNDSSGDKEIFEPVHVPKFSVLYNDTPIHRGPDNFDWSNETDLNIEFPVIIDDNNLIIYNKTNFNKNISLTDWLESKFNSTNNRKVTGTYAENFGNQTVLREDSSYDKNNNSIFINNTHFSTKNKNIQEEETTVRGFGIQNLTNYHSAGFETPIHSTTRNTNVQEGKSTNRGFGIQNLTNYHDAQEPNSGLEIPILSTIENTNVQEEESTVRRFGIQNLTNYHSAHEPNSGSEIPKLPTTGIDNVQEGESTVRRFGIQNLTNYHSAHEPNSGLEIPILSTTRNDNVQEEESTVRGFGIQNLTNYHSAHEPSSGSEIPKLSTTGNANVQEEESTVHSFGIQNLTNYHSAQEPNSGLEIPILSTTRNDNAQEGESTVRGFGIQNLTNYHSAQEPNSELDIPILSTTRNTNVPEEETTVRGFGIQNLTNYHAGATKHNQTFLGNDLELENVTNSHMPTNIVVPGLTTTPYYITAVNMTSFLLPFNATRMDELKPQENKRSTLDSNINNDFNTPTEKTPYLNNNQAATPDREFGIQNLTNYHTNKGPKTAQIPGTILNSEQVTDFHNMTSFTNTHVTIANDDPTKNIAETENNAINFPNILSTRNTTQTSIFEDTSEEINNSNNESSKTLPNFFFNIPLQTKHESTTTRVIGTKSIPRFLVVQITRTNFNSRSLTHPYRVTIPTNKPMTGATEGPELSTSVINYFNKSDERTQNHTIHFPDEFSTNSTIMENINTGSSKNFEANNSVSRESKLYLPPTALPQSNNHTIAPNQEGEVNLNRIDFKDSERGVGQSFPNKGPSNYPSKNNSGSISGKDSNENGNHGSSLPEIFSVNNSIEEKTTAVNEHVRPGSPKNLTALNPENVDNPNYTNNFHPGLPYLFTVNITEMSVETSSKKGARNPSTKNGDTGSNFFNSILLGRAAQEATLVEAQRRSKVIRKHSESNDAMIVMGVLAVASVMAGTVFLFVRYTRKKKQKLRQWKNKAKIEPWEKYVVKLKKARSVEPARPILTVQPV